LRFPVGGGPSHPHAIGRRAYVTRVTPMPDGLEVQADVERVEKFLRDWRIVREPLAPLSARGDPAAPLSASGARPEIPAGRYVALGAAGEVVAAGTTQEAPGGRLALRFARALKPGTYTVLLALPPGANW